MHRQRIENLKNYLYLAATFRNAAELIQASRHGLSCDQAVMWNGTRLIHPQDRGGLVGTIIELWKDECYTRQGFYRPQDGDQIVDVGAHVGLFSLQMAFQNPRCQVLSLEPFPENYACLQSNLAAAAVTNVETLPYALGGVEKNAFMHAVGERSIDHLLRQDSSDGDTAVKVISLSGILAHLDTDQVALLKLDAEGAEYDAFSAATPETLRSFQRIAMEYHDNLRPGTLDLLRRKLEPSHDLIVEPTFDRGYGILLATRR